MTCCVLPQPQVYPCASGQGLPLCSSFMAGPQPCPHPLLPPAVAVQWPSTCRASHTLHALGPLQHPERAQGYPNNPAGAALTSERMARRAHTRATSASSSSKTKTPRQPPSRCQRTRRAAVARPAQRAAGMSRHRTLLPWCSRRLSRAASTASNPHRLVTASSDPSHHQTPFVELNHPKTPLMHKPRDH